MVYLALKSNRLSAICVNQANSHRRSMDTKFMGAAIGPGVILSNPCSFIRSGHVERYG